MSQENKDKSIKVTLDDLANEALHPVAIPLGRGQNLIDSLAIAETNRCSRRVNRELLRQVTRHLRFVSHEQSLEIAHVLEGPAVSELPARVDR